MRPGFISMMAARCITPGIPLPPVNPYTQFKTYNSTADSNSHQVTFDTAPQAGHLLVLIASAGLLLDLPTPATWVKDVTLVNDLETSIYSKISDGSETTITITTSGGGSAGCQLVAIEFPTWTTFDQSSTDTDSVAGAPNVPFNNTGTTTAASEIAIAVGGLNLAFPSGDTRPTVSWANGFTELSHEGSINGAGPPYSQMLGVALLVLTATGAVTTTWTLTTPASTVGVWNALIATYK